MNDKAVSYPEVLDMASFSTNYALLDGWGSAYRLAGIVVRPTMGKSSQSGHYFYVQRDPLDGWLERNDTVVRRVDRPLEYTKKVVGLVYHRICPVRSAFIFSAVLACRAVTALLLEAVDDGQILCSHSIAPFFKSVGCRCSTGPIQLGIAVQLWTAFCTMRLHLCKIPAYIRMLFCSDCEH